MSTLPFIHRAIFRRLLMLLLLLGPAVVQAQTKEYQVKAVFLLNFAQFVRWPASAFADAEAPLTLGILGDDPFGGVLAAALNGERANGRPLAIRRGQTVGELKGCQFIFVSKSESARLGEVLAGLQGSSVLTVGESAPFCSQGGMINFTVQGGTVGFEINSAAAKRAGLGISTKLIKLGKLIRNS